MRRLRALPVAALLIAAAATPLAAQESALDRVGIWSSVLTDFPAWVAAPGRPGYTPNAERMTNFPRVRGGLAMGAWSIDDARRGELELPWPGLAGVSPALSWGDSVAFGPTTIGDAGDLSPALAGASAHEGPGGGARTRAVVGSLLQGFDAREPVVWIARGDSMRSASYGLLSGQRDATGAYGLSGRHLWSADVALRFGAQRVAGAFMQRAQAMELASGERGSGSGATGFLDYQVAQPGWRFTARGERGWDFQESVLAVPDPADSNFALLEGSRRDAQENRLAAALDFGRRSRALTLRGQWSEARVRRDQSPFFETRGRQWALGLEARSPLGEGGLDFALTVANQDVVDRTVWMPSLAYRVRTDAFDGGASIARLALPVWADLAPGQAPFLQDTWVAGLDAGTLIGERAHARIAAQLGRTTDRAVLVRLPIEDLWLRNGAVADPEPWTFGLYTLSAAWEGTRSAVRGEGFVLKRDVHAIQPKVDPGHGARAEAEWGFTAFQGDLGVMLRADGAIVGPRESESIASRRLDGYVTSGATAIVTLGDAMVMLRMANLENQRHEEAWIDLATGREALGPGREIRVSVMVRLSD